MPIRRQSGRSDISSDRGRTSPGSCPSTMEAPPSNQDGLHRIQVIQRTQEVFGRTLTKTKCWAWTAAGTKAAVNWGDYGRSRWQLSEKLHRLSPFGAFHSGEAIMKSSLRQ